MMLDVVALCADVRTGADVAAERLPTGPTEPKRVVTRNVIHTKDVPAAPSFPPMTGFNPDAYSRASQPGRRSGAIRGHARTRRALASQSRDAARNSS